MKIAIGLPTAVPGAPGGQFPDWARRAEEAGFAGLGTLGRSVFDSHEELVVLAAAAAVTDTIRLATTLIVAPPRDAVLLAKQAASLDNLSGGRLALGLGVGWREDDFKASGATFKGRGRALEEQIRVLRRVWSGEPVGDGVGPVGPPPAQKGGPPIWLGGTAPPALRRAGRLADAFIATPIPAGGVQAMYEIVQKAREESGRPGRIPLIGAGYFALGDQVGPGLENMRTYYAAGGEDFVKVMTDGLLKDADAVRAHVESYREIGMDELFLWPASSDIGQVEALAKVVF